MSSRTYVCLTCEKSYRRDQADAATCPICQNKCEYVDWKIRIPAPKRKRQWKQFWEKYKAEKRSLKDFYNDPNAEELKLDLHNLHLARDKKKIV